MSHKIAKWMVIACGFLVMGLAFAQEESGDAKKGHTTFKYKKFEQFDFEDMVVDGGLAGPGDLSIAPRMQERFKNKLPYRKNFNPELRRSMIRVR